MPTFDTLDTLLVFAGAALVLAGALGVSALIMASAAALTALKVVGGPYLLHLALQTWRSAGAAALPDGSTSGTEAGARRALRQGAVVEAASSKTAAFLLALTPQFVDPSFGGAALQFGGRGLVSVVLNTAGTRFAVMMAGAVRARVLARPSLLRRLRQGSTAILGGLGAWLLLSRWPG